MRSHLAKCGAFVTLQVGLFAAIYAISNSRSPVPAATTVGTYSLEQRAETFLREKLYPVWANNRQAFVEIAQAPGGQDVLRESITAFRRGPDNYLAALIEKDELLKSTPGRRLILVGGSGCAFGFDSEALRDRYGYEPINMGLHAGLGVTFMLNHVATSIRSGDVVILCFEPSCLIYDVGSLEPTIAETIRNLNQGYEKYYEETPFASEQVAQEVPSSSWRANLLVAKRFADKEALPAAAAKVRQSRDALLTMLQNEDEVARKQRVFNAEFDDYRDRLVTVFLAMEVTPIYRRTNFNKFGDFVGHRLAPERKPDDLPLAVSPLPASLTSEEERNITHGIAQINAFALACTKRGAKVLFSHPPLMKTQSTTPFAHQMSAIVGKNLKVPVLFPIEETVFDEMLYWDTDDHLNWRGTCWRMEKLMLALDEHLPPKLEQSVASQLAARNNTNWGRTAVADTNPNSWR